MITNLGPGTQTHQETTHLDMWLAQSITGFPLPANCQLPCSGSNKKINIVVHWKQKEKQTKKKTTTSSIALYWQNLMWAGYTERPNEFTSVTTEWVVKDGFELKYTRLITCTSQDISLKISKGLN
jgi:hypothetical protein